MAELVFFRRGEEVLRFGLDRPRVLVGRGERCDVVIPDPEVSRQQLALVQHGEHWRIEDLSGKGTQVAGERVAGRELQDGTDLTLGQWRAIFRERAPGLGDEATRVSGTQTELQGAQETGALAAQLRIRQAEAESVFRLGDAPLVLGKDATCDLIVMDRFISGQHLKVARRGNRFHVVDLGSTNGTFLGTARVHDVELPVPSVLRIGETELAFEAVQASSRREEDFHGIIGRDPSVRHLVELIERVAPSPAAVTLLGESGTGKELVARALHACSPRASRALIPVNCAAISRELIESELFGHERGAFSGAVTSRKGAFEEADGGTLFLDEIGELPLELQAKLLRALESGEIKRVGASRPSHVDVRVVAATNRDLGNDVKEGRFREDLYYRLCVVPLHLTPLRGRKADLPLLVDHFLKAFSPKDQKVQLSAPALERLQAHLWPGNIRELRNVIHRALLLRRGAVIEASDITFDRELNAATGIALPEATSGLTLEAMLEKVERQIVERALQRCHNNRERVAKELGVARSTLFKRLKDWGLTSSDDAAA